MLLAMGRRSDAPEALMRLDSAGNTPYVSVTVVRLLVAGLAGVGSIKTAWSFSAFTVLMWLVGSCRDTVRVGLLTLTRRVGSQDVVFQYFGAETV